MADYNDFLKAFEAINDYKSSVANNNNNTSSKASNITSSNKSAYQANLSTPTQTQQQNFSTRFIMGQIATLGNSDPTLANQYYQKLQYSMADPKSQYYNPYNQPTNRAVSNLAALGFDINNLNDNWWNANQGWVASNLVYNGTTNTPSSVKKGTQDQKIAYELYQWKKSEDTTKKAEQEWAALQEELKYLANDKAHNYSDDTIINMIDWSKYKTLASMDENKYTQPTELNRAIGYSKDAMYGALWQARNPDMDVDMWGAMANSALKTGNQWQDDPLVASKSDPSSENYSPYELGMTLTEEGKYFGVYEFTQKTLDDIRATLDWNDATAVKNYQNALKAFKTTEKLKEQLNTMNEDIDELLKWYDDPQEIIDIIKDDPAYADLRKLDDTLESNDLEKTTSAIKYRWKDVEQRIKDACYAKNGAKAIAAVQQYVLEHGGNYVSDEEIAKQQAYEEAEQEAYNIIMPSVKQDGTDSEQTAAKTGSSMFDAAVSNIISSVGDYVAAYGRSVQQDIQERYMPTLRQIYDFDGHVTNRDNAQADLDKILPEWTALDNKARISQVEGNMTPDEYANLISIYNSGDWEIYKETLESPENYNALISFYRTVTGNLDIPEEDVLEGKVSQYVDILNHYTSNTDELQDAVEEASRTGANNFIIKTGNEVGYSEGNEDNEYVVDFLGYDDETGKPIIRAVGNNTGEVITDYDELHEKIGYADLSPLSDEELARYNMLSERKAELDQMIAGENDYISRNEQLYKDAQWERDMIAKQVAETSGDENLVPAINYMFDISQEYVPTEYPTALVYDTLYKAGEISKEESTAYALTNTHYCLQEAETLQSLYKHLTDLGINFSEEEKANIQRKIDDVKLSAEQSAYAVLDGAEDFRTVADETKAKVDSGEIKINFSDMVRAAMTGHDTNTVGLEKVLNLFTGVGRMKEAQDAVDTEFILNHLEDEELDRFYYLLGKDGVEAAQHYLDVMLDPERGIVTSRASGQKMEAIQKLASSGPLQATLVTLGSFASNLMAGPSAYIYEASQLLQGKEVSPVSRYFDYQNVTGAGRAGAKEYFVDKFGGEKSPVGSFVGMLYDGITSAVDSRINASIMTGLLGDLTEFLGNTKFGSWLSGAISNAKDGEGLVSKILTNIENEKGFSGFLVKAGKDLTHASSMGLNAASAAYRDAITKGAKQDQAMMMAIATFFAETGSEAITVGNIHEAMAKGGDEAKRGLRDFLITFFKNGSEEFLGEGANEWIESEADRIIMGALSDYEKNVKSYTDNGYPETLARQLADQQIWKDVLKAGAVGFISSAFGTPGDYIRGMQAESNENQRKIFEQAMKDMVELAQESTEENVSPEQQAQDEAAYEEYQKRVREEEAKQQELEAQKAQRDKSLVILKDAFNSDAKGASVAIASSLNTGDVHADKAAAQYIVDKMANGDTGLATKTMYAIFSAGSEVTPEMLGAEVPSGVQSILPKYIELAALTNGQGNAAIQNALAKTKNGEQLTPEDVSAIIKGVSNDMIDPHFFATYDDAVKASRIANRTIEIYSQSAESIKGEKDKAKSANQSLEAAQEKLDRAEDERAAAGQAAIDAIDQQMEDPQNNDTNADVQRSFAQVDSKDNEVIAKAEADVEAAKQNAEQAQKDKDLATTEAFNNARQQAQQEVEQEMAQEAEAKAQQQAEAEAQAQQQANEAATASMQTYKPTYAFSQPITVNRVGGQGSVQITGIFAELPNGNTIYTTTDGYVSSEVLEDIPNESLPIFDAAHNNVPANGAQPVQPAVWLKHSITANANGKKVEIVGFAGQYHDTPVAMDAEGNVYNGEDLTDIHDPLHPEKTGAQAYFDLAEEVGLDNLPEVTRQELYADEYSEGSTQPDVNEEEEESEAGNETSGYNYESYVVKANGAQQTFVDYESAKAKAEELALMFGDVSISGVEGNNVIPLVTYDTNGTSHTLTHPDTQTHQNVENEEESQTNEQTNPPMYIGTQFDAGPNGIFHVKFPAGTDITVTKNGTTKKALGFTVDHNGQLVVALEDGTTAFPQEIAGSQSMDAFKDWIKQHPDFSKWVIDYALPDMFSDQQKSTPYIDNKLSFDEASQWTQFFNDQLQQTTHGISQEDIDDAVADAVAEEIANQTTQQKVNPETGKPLKNWQDPKYHGKVRPAHKRSTKSAAFKKWFSSKMAPEAKPYLTNADGSPKVFFRGWGKMGEHIHVEHKSSPVGVSPEGKKYYKNFYSDNLDVSSSYAYTNKVNNMRVIENWETAAAAMKDLGLKLVETSNPNGNGQWGYQVMQKASPSSNHLVPGQWFAENELAKFRMTYGGSPTSTGVFAGYITCKKPLIIDAHGSSWSNFQADVTAADGTHKSATMDTDGWAKWAFNHGNDAVIVANVKDSIHTGNISATDIITRDSDMFKSVFNKGTWSGDNIMEKKEAAPTKLEQMMGKKLSFNFKNAVARLSRGKDVSLSELMNLPEVKWILQQKSTGSTVSDDLMKKYKQTDDWANAIEEELDPEVVERIHKVKAKLAKYGSVEFDSDGNVVYTGEVAKNKRLDLLIGLPASGKTSIAKHLSNKFKSMVGDADLAKTENPLNRDGLNEDYIHNESKIANDQRLMEAAQRGDNVLFSVIGDNAEDVARRIQPFVKNGYSVHVHMTDLNQNKALSRVLSRLTEEGRYLDLPSLMSIDPAKILETFNTLKEEGVANDYVRWNTDVNRDANPVPVEFSNEGETDIFTDAGRQSNVSESLGTGPENNGTGTQKGMDNGGRSGGLNIQAKKATPMTPMQKQTQKVKAKYSPYQIAKSLTQDLGFGDYIGTRKFGNLPANVLGYFEQRAKYIGVRTKEAGNFETTLHEVGHGLAEKYGLKATAEMVNSLPAEFANQYQPDELNGEAMAEFVWRYLASEDLARQFAGDEFYDAFEAKLRRTSDWKAIQQAKNNLHTWLEADAGEQIGATIHNRDSIKNIGLKRFFREAIDAAVDNTAAANEFDRRIAELAKEAGVELNALDKVRMQALRANTAGKQATSILTGAGLTDANGNRIGESYADAIANTGFRATGENMDLLVRYMLAQHSLDRDVQKKPVFDEHVTPEARQAFIDDVERNHPEVAKAAEAHWDFHRKFMQEFMVNTGRLSQAAFDKMNEIYPHYVPTYRVQATDGIAQRTGKGKTYAVQHAKGSTQDIYNPIDSWFGMVNTIVSQNALNRAGLAFDRMYNQFEGLGTFAHPVIKNANSTEMTDMTTKQQKVYDLVNGMIDADTMGQLMNIVGQGGFNQEPSASHDTLKVVRPDGTVVEYQFSDMELFKLLAGVNNKNSNAALDAVGFLTRGMSALTTGSNPIFAVRNFMRDFQNSVNYGSWASNYGTGVLKWLASAYEVWRGTDAYKDYEALGGGGWTRIDPSRRATRNELYSEAFKGYNTSNVGRTAKWIGKKVWNGITLARLNEIIEQSSRFAEYKYGKHDLKTEAGRVEAYLAAQEATVDFNRSGNSGLATMMKKLVPFFNASAQGVYRTTRMLTEEERGRAPARFAKTVLNTAFLSALCSGILMKKLDDDDKEEFAMLSDDLKAKHFYLPNFAPSILGEAPLIRIPLAQDPLTYAIHGAVTNAMWNGSSDGLMIDLAATANAIIDNLNPVGSTVFAPILAINANKSWYGNRIVPSYLERNKFAPDQYTEETPDLFVGASRWLHEATGGAVSLSPMKIQYLAEQYTGFLGQLLIPAFSKENGELGGLDAAINAARKRFTSDPLTSNDVVSSFYDGADVLNSVIEETNQGKPLNILRRGLTQEEAGQAYEEAKSITSGIISDTKSEINTLYDEIDTILASDLSEHDKYQLASEKRRQIVDLALTANERIGEYKEKYVTGSNLATRMLTEGSASYKPTDIDKMSPVFKADMDTDKVYMQRALSVYNGDKEGSHKEAALPHPSQTFTAKDRRGNEVEYTIPDDEWDKYQEIYKREYEQTIIRKGARWDTMTDKQQYDVLKAAHTAANKKMKDAYIKTHQSTSSGTGGGGGRPAEIPERPASDNDWDSYMEDLDNYWANYDFERNDPVGQYGKGTIDMNDRKVVHNDDGSISTDLSFSFYDSKTGKEVLIPRVVDGKILTEQQAKEHYYKTVEQGKPEYFGMFDDWHDADEYAIMLHNRGDWYYHR